MHEWWENDLPLILAALRRLHRGQRVYIHISAAGWRFLTALAVLAIVTACASDPAPAAPDPAAIASAVQATVAALPQPDPVQVEVTRIVQVEVTRIVEATRIVQVEATPTPPPPQVIGQPGQTVEAGGIAMTVHGAALIQSVSAYDSAPAGSTYLVVDVLIQNTSAEPLSYNPYYFTVKDSNSFEYSGGETVPDPRFSSGQLAPGDSVRGNVGFLIPTNAAGLVLSHDIMGRFQPLRVAIAPDS